jgi:nondiscriminating glutamyl-tRNA synthetase
LYEYLVAKKDGGDFILRIEDTDQARLVEGSVEIIYDTLAQVGLIHDEGPDKPGKYGPYVQSERLPMYKKYALELVKLGGAHVCFCQEDIIQGQRDAAEKAGVPFKFSDPCHFLESRRNQLNALILMKRMSSVKPSNLEYPRSFTMKSMATSKSNAIS